MMLRFGGTVLHDNFVAELSTHYQNSAEFLSFYGLLNFYLYTMAFVYSPSKNAVFGKFCDKLVFVVAFNTLDLRRVFASVLILIYCNSKSI